MKWLGAIAAIWFVSASLQAQGVDPARLSRLDDAITAAIKRGDAPGAVLVVVHEDQVVYRKAFGLKAKQPAEAAMTVDTIFDLASLTKPLATATSIMVLLEQGKLKLSDKVAKHWPAFAANGKADVTVEHLLVHTSGLIADNAIADYAEGRPSLEKIADLKLEAPLGSRFRYSDVGFIVLGELIERISGQPVDQFARKEIFAPLKMVDTSYTPTELKRIAPTGLRKGEIILGQVHDPRAHAMGGVAGHAGLFGTADDLARYCRMLLRGGELDGKRILAPLTVSLFTKPVSVPGGERSRGWDVDTSFSSQRGELFPAGDGFGHTGFTGTSIWIDPPSKTAIILLTNRVHPADKGNVVELRRQVGTLVAASLTGPAESNRRPPRKPTLGTDQ